MRRMLGFTTAAFAALTMSAFAASAFAAEPLTGYGVDIRQTSVSGVSSGGAMAVQMHVAFSSIMKGVGITAGLAYDCADSDNRFDLARLNNMIKCMNGRVPASASTQRTDEAATENAIDAVYNLKGQKVWLLHGEKDNLVAGTAMHNLAEYYKHFVDDDNVLLKILPGATHAQITDNFGAVCPNHGRYYISDCDFDSAGELLKFIYDDGHFQPRNDGEPSGTIKPFDQRPFFQGNPKPYGLADTGYLYVPSSCEGEAAATCRVHVAFHGCAQSATNVGDAFYRHAGYNATADTNNIIVLYPQTYPISVLGYVVMDELKKGCWDWFGYSGFAVTGRYDANYARRTGYQLSAIRRMLGCLEKSHGSAC